MTDQYYVIGNPIEHSRSPEIHRLFAAQTGEPITYAKWLAPVGQFAEVLHTLIGQGMRGANVTVPFKEDAFQCCDDRSQRAERAGAVNTLSVDSDGRLFGDNTDGIGLMADLTRNHRLELAGKHILLVGAGGAVRGVLEPLLQQNPAQLVIVNRTVAKAHALANDFAALGAVSGCGFDDLAGQPFDIVINGTSAGLTGEMPPLAPSVLRDGGTSYDMLYGAEPTPFVRWGKAAGAAVALDGLGMLVEQAAAAFHLWRAKQPNTRAVIDTLRQQLHREVA